MPTGHCFVVIQQSVERGTVPAVEMLIQFIRFRFLIRIILDIFLECGIILLVIYIRTCNRSHQAVEYLIIGRQRTGEVLVLAVDSLICIQPGNRVTVGDRAVSTVVVAVHDPRGDTVQLADLPPA